MPEPWIVPARARGRTRRFRLLALVPLALGACATEPLPPAVTDDAPLFTQPQTARLDRHVWNADLCGYSVAFSGAPEFLSATPRGSVSSFLLARWQDGVLQEEAECACFDLDWSTMTPFVAKRSFTDRRDVDFRSVSSYRHAQLGVVLEAEGELRTAAPDGRRVSLRRFYPNRCVFTVRAVTNASLTYERGIAFLNTVQRPPQPASTARP